MSFHNTTLQWIDSQHDRLRQLVVDWAGINSGTHNLSGLATLAARLVAEFSILGGELRLIDLPAEETIDARGRMISTSLGQAISIRKREDAPLRVFLGIHYDTVYGPDDPFQKVDAIDEKTLRGPGVVDAKGGLAVMLVALEAIERNELAPAIGWEVLINPDEEIGSPGSAHVFKEAAARNQFGLVFEPAFPDGSMVNERKGSGNFSAVIRGKAAHAGRDFQSGRNAIAAAADFAMAVHGLNGTISDATFNVGRIDGGGPVNVVPDLAILRFNVRIARGEDQQAIEIKLAQLGRAVGARHQVSLQLHGGFLSPPKMLDEATRRLCERVEICGNELAIPIAWTRSGGASDGNKLAAAGLPVIDTFGPIGGNLHSPEEYLFVPSLTERARLAALLLLKVAGGELVAKGLPPDIT